MIFNRSQKPFFSHKRAQSLSKNLFLPLSLRKTMLLRRDICKSFAIYLQGKTFAPRQTANFRSQQSGSQGERQGSRLRTLRLTGELDSHDYRHHPEHTGKRLALFPLISKGGARYCSRLETTLVVCSPTLKARKGRFVQGGSADNRPMCRQVRALIKSKHGVAYCVLSNPVQLCISMNEHKKAFTKPNKKTPNKKHYTAQRAFNSNPKGQGGLTSVAQLRPPFPPHGGTTQHNTTTAQRRKRPKGQRGQKCKKIHAPEIGLLYAI